MLIKVAQNKTDKIFIAACIFMLVFLLPINSIQALEKINLNTAIQTELETLPGIGPSKAQAIIDYREQSGPFTKIEDIMYVKGVGETIFSKIKDLIAVEYADKNTDNLGYNADNADENDTNNDSQMEQYQISYSDQVVINELLPNPTGSDETEWIELKNLGSLDVDLNGWQIGDATDKKFTISNLIISASGFVVLEKSQTGISLNNSGGETLKLFWPDRSLIQTVGYSDVAQENYAWARDEDGSYKWTEVLTPGKENVIRYTDKPGYTTDSADGEADSSKDKQPEGSAVYSEFKDKILITEILPNPYGLDTDANEWLEIYNTSTQAVDLDGWKLRDNLNEYSFTKTVLSGRSFIILTRGQTGLILNNSGGDKLDLVDGQDKLVFEISYKKYPFENQSYNLCSSHNQWLWLEEISPDKENKCPPVNQDPEAYFEASKLEVKVGEEELADANESYDIDGEIVRYSWQFSQPVEIVDTAQVGDVFEFYQPQIKFKFLSAGKQKIILKTLDNLGGTDEFSQDIEVKMALAQVQDWSKIYINEILPDPEGQDALGEFIELFNSADKEVDLGGFILDDGEGGSKAYQIMMGSIIPANAYLVFDRATTNLALNNDFDSIRLFDPQGNLIDQVNYDEVETGMSYSRGEDGVWYWTNISKNEKNKLPVINPEYSGLPISKINYYQNVSLEDVSNLEKGDRLVTKGIISVEPGTIGANIFYISNQDSPGGVQVYMYTKDFPLLGVGDLVQVTGEKSDYYNEVRIKIQNKNDIKILALAQDKLLTPYKISLDEIAEEWEGSLIKVQGEITEIKGQYFWIDDGLAEVRIYIKDTTDISLKVLDLKPGDYVEVTGILSETSSGFRVLPRYKDDIIIKKVLGEKLETGGEKQESEWKNYLIVTLIATTTVLGGLMTRRYKNK